MIKSSLVMHRIKVIRNGILGFYLSDLRFDDCCYPPCWCLNKPAQQRSHSKKVSLKMFLCVIFGYGSRSDRDKGIGFYRVPSVATNKGEFEEELTNRTVYSKHALSRSEIDIAVAKRLEIIAHVTNCCKRPITE